MRVGIVILPEHRWWVAEPKWRTAEEYGFDHAWTYDHLGWRSLVDGPWFGAVPTLTAAAMVTSRIRLGMMVASPNFRHPVSFARDLITLDDVSDGRFTLGVGAGGLGGYDSEVLGQQPLTAGQRAGRFEEFVELLDRQLTTPRTTWAGEWYEAVEARSAPGCVQSPRVPFVVAANGPRTMRLAARFGNGWVTTGTDKRDDVDQWWRGVAEASGRMDDALAATDRRLGKLDRYLQADACPTFVLSSRGLYEDTLGRAAELGFTDVVAPWPRHDGVYAGAEAVLEDVAAEVLPKLVT
ncbi:LLM class flavin-dependent oxidoreductase [Kutzneria chonburiensis]|uniref:LLM class flavin-dependent oxidoreductase n=1 Tax=Kutzneria chonburiensis TaxID=1483604 RepID=A0ABV6N3F2_9PSEU|nr:LLM class flavin-dependent oxidoreductase [Kutzneria chonburiensis]